VNKDERADERPVQGAGVNEGARSSGDEPPRAGPGASEGTRSSGDEPPRAGPGAGEGTGSSGDAPAERAAEEQQTPELAARVAQLEDRYRRALADLDNYRKRSAREIERRVEDAREGLLRDWLDAVDSVERALQMDAPEGGLQQGLRAVLEQMETTLARHGVTRIGAAGEPFDPERHEAIAVRETGDVPDRTVLEVMRSGWAVRGRVLRPAQVVVARAPQPAT
jgi:molecular chaperone GrpE